ncbi:mucin-6-like [Centruroides sculpturatus]|uniref:mucin-6-like n=1 Tax=Centruroides sculpturatus TaxID=218467 RepID=UPI000C6DCE15|nr:mucin-6-like [Centruroides sculpturatus]
MKIPNNSTSCGSEELKYLYCFGVATTEECMREPCRCNGTYSMDRETKKCLPPTKCTGCMFYGRKLQREDTIYRHSDCQIWKCSEDKSMGVSVKDVTDEYSETVCFNKLCRVWGQEHILTFDKELPIFDKSTCFYYLLKHDKYSIAYKNIRCPKSDIVCSIEVEFEVENETVHLPKYLNSTEQKREHFTVYEKGIWIVVHSDKQIILAWDRGTRVYIYVSENLKTDTVSGLCTGKTIKKDADCIRVSKTYSDEDNIEITRKSTREQCRILDEKIFQDCEKNLPKFGDLKGINPCKNFLHGNRVNRRKINFLLHKKIDKHSY